MLSDILRFMRKKPGTIKRALIANNRIICWTTEPRKSVFEAWKSLSKQPLRIVPSTPKEGCLTQEYWNQLWDNSKRISNRIRKVHI